jgi:SAM-dependent methyltransferase
MTDLSIVAAPASFLRQAAKSLVRRIPAIRRLIRQRDDLLRERKSQFHFVEEYEQLVSYLMATMPIDEAMAAAVGGVADYEATGRVERDLLIWAGLRDGMSIVDIGCGSGRLAHMLGQSVNVEYLGTDIVQALLDYAKRKSPPNYAFLLHREMSVPAPDRSADFVTAFSVFTHLLHSESYLYLEDIRRVLKPDGKVVFSFLEFADAHHWPAFESEIEARQTGRPTVLNTMIERSAIECWADRLGYIVERFVDGTAAPWQLWQALAILRLKD